MGFGKRERRYAGVRCIELKLVTLDPSAANDRRRCRLRHQTTTNEDDDDEDIGFPQYAPTMADEESNHHLIDSPSPPLLAMRHQSTFSAAENGGCGEIVEVQGGHIVRSTGRKDRHSKVCTAKGPRDRRVRLSAPTAIQFYDVQDRLGFDRPSKAVDWLIKKAKSAIDNLAELPPWNPADTIRQAAANAKPRRSKTAVSPTETGIRGASVSTRASGEETEHPHHHHHHHHQSSFLPASMDSDSIADTIKSFFPVVSTEAIQQNYHQPPSDFPSRANSQNQDLRLSLQSFQNGPPFANQTEHALFSGQSNPSWDQSNTSWDQSQQNHHQSPEFGRMQRLVTWNNGGAADPSAATGGGFVDSWNNECVLVVVFWISTQM
ncbi:unnamed protein product [Thlaspi arvense]|uniref:TCP domain-containing protein n=1 Tax=Thlaspi arvense TaxID=13288 RepID=A0AAU9R9P9_THLAR|nr:unnamed protein product [Thlaspi arvense]